ncbi:hypothetical protein [Maribacter arcticus]
MGVMLVIGWIYWFFYNGKSGLIHIILVFAARAILLSLIHGIRI